MSMRHQLVLIFIARIASTRAEIVTVQSAETTCAQSGLVCLYGHGDIPLRFGRWHPYSGDNDMIEKGSSSV
jgi:hypothetical protein